MKQVRKRNNTGFSMVEMLIAITIMLILLGLVSTLFARALGSRERESRRTDALTSAQAALNVMSREIANSGYGLTYNGLILADSNAQRLHFRSNVQNSNLMTNSPGEDITYYLDANTLSIVRYDPRGTWNATTNTFVPKTSLVVNRISDLKFSYFDYAGINSAGVEKTAPTTDTGRVRITVTVNLENVFGQPDNQTVTYTSDVTLRNANYMLDQY